MNCHNCTIRRQSHTYGSIGSFGGRLAILTLRVPIPAISSRTIDISPVVCLYSKRPFVFCSMSVMYYRHLFLHKHVFLRHLSGSFLPTVQGYVVVRIPIHVCHRLKSLGLMVQKYILLSAVAPPFPRPTSTRYLLAALLITNTLSATTHSLCRTTQVENTSQLLTTSPLGCSPRSDASVHQDKASQRQWCKTH
jgi:hypothetical protein